MNTTFMVPFCGTMKLMANRAPHNAPSSHTARDALTLRFLVFVNRATAGQATGGNDNDTSALKSEIKICHATECEAAKGFFEAFPHSVTYFN